MAKDYFYISHYGRKGMKWGKNIFEEEPSNASNAYRRLGAAQTSRAQQSPRAQEAWRQAAASQRARSSVSSRSIWENKGATQEKALQAWLQRNRVNRESDPNVKAMRDAVNRQRLERAAESTRGTQLAATNRWLEKTGGPSINPRNNTIGPDAAAMAKRAEAQARQASSQAAKDSAAANARIDREKRGTSIRDKAEYMDLEKSWQQNLQKAYGSAIAAANQNAAMSKAANPLSAHTKNTGVEQMEREKAAFDELLAPGMKEEMRREGISSTEALRRQAQKYIQRISRQTDKGMAEFKKQVANNPEMKRAYDATQYLTKMLYGESLEDLWRKNRKASTKTFTSKLVEG